MWNSPLIGLMSPHSVTREPSTKGKWKSYLGVINYRVFLVPAIFLIVGALIWFLALVYWPTNYFLILLGEVLFAIGLFVAIILGFWVMTIVRLPQR
ncbi:MAG: hypothetical protein ACFFDP_04735 [Promethearchaeota archaeon]